MMSHKKLKLCSLLEPDSVKQCRTSFSLRSLGSGHFPGVVTILDKVAEKGSIDLLKTVLSWSMTCEPRNPLCRMTLLRAISSGQTGIVSYSFNMALMSTIPRSRMLLSMLEIVMILDMMMITSNMAGVVRVIILVTLHYWSIL
jgi:hypothetical protein